jgi:hypothetical protein
VTVSARGAKNRSRRRKIWGITSARWGDMIG